MSTDRSVYFKLRAVGSVAVGIGLYAGLGSLSSALGQGIGIGLYKDGQLVEQLSSPIILADPQLQSRAEKGDASAVSQMKPEQRAALARPNNPIGISDAQQNAFTQSAMAEARVRTILHELKSSGLSEAGLLSLRAARDELTLAYDGIQGALAESEVHALRLGAGNAAMTRQDATATAIATAYRNVSEAIERVLTGQSGALDQAISLVDSMAPPAPAPLAGRPPTVQVEVRQAPNLTREEADARLARATKNAPSSTTSLPPPTAADLAATVEVQLTSEIITKAAALGNSPLAIYEFVRNKVRFQPYLGSRKGAVETLHQLHGNDTDQASLLLALLRAANIPCRYVRGTVEMTPDQAKSWVGVDDAGTAGGILTTVGMDGVNIINGQNVVTAVRCTRVWVEAYIPYSNYRGVPNESTGKTWVPLDPAFSLSTITAGQDVLTPMGFNTDSFLADYISTFHALSPIEKFVADIQTYLNSAQPGTTVAQVERTAVNTSQMLGLLPASLPYQVRSISSRFSELEDAKRYKVRFRLYNGGTTFIDYTTNISQIIGGRLTIDYVGATAADQAIIDAHGGIFETPPNLVNVKPRVKLNGTPLVTSSNSIGMGLTHNSDMQFLQPSGASNAQPQIQNTIIAGNTQAIGFDTFLDLNDATLFGPAGASLLESLLFSNAITYLNRVDRGQETVGALMRVVTTQDVSEAIVENAVSVTTSFGIPVTFVANGLTVDADRRIIGPFAVNGNASKDVPYMFLTGYDGSTMENRLFEDSYSQAAVSTIKILELSRDQGIPTYKIVTSIAADAPGLNQPSSIVNAINAALAMGHQVIIPRNQITVGSWVGTGYIDLNPTTGAAGYIISGGISGSISANGGATVVQQWSKPLACSATNVTCEVNTPSADTPAAGAVFGGMDTGTLHFAVTLHVTCKDGSMSTVPWNFQTTSSIKSIADNFGAGNYTLTVSALGSTSCSRTVTIFTVESQTVATAPTNRKRTILGVGEEVDFSVKPSTISVSWSVTPSSGGNLSSTNGSSTTLTCPDRASVATIRASFPSASPWDTQINIIEPSSLSQVPAPTSGGGVEHHQGRPDVGMMADFYVGPDTVNFYNAQFRERDVPAVCSGVYAPFNGIGHQPNPNPVPLTMTVVSGLGTKGPVSDHIYSGDPGSIPPFPVGTEDFNIPWEFKVGNGAYKQFTTVLQRCQLSAGDALTASKAGASRSTTVSSPTSSY